MMRCGDYVFSMDQNNFTNAGLKETHLHTDHWMVLAVIRREGETRNHRYLRGCTLWPIQRDTIRPQIEREAAFNILKGRGGQYAAANDGAGGLNIRGVVTVCGYMVSTA